MGAVYEAEQDQPRRLVALKVIRAAWAGPELIRRFEQESQALARLQHAGIAQIYEAGAAETPFGVQPYFAMELIHGKPLAEYAEEHKLSTQQRLELMIAVCEAVEQAHQRGIIHRDLKPANILVDETGQPRIRLRPGARHRRRCAGDAPNRHGPASRHAGLYEPRAGASGSAVAGHTQ